MDARLRAVCDLMVAEAREYAGLHDYDGVLQDLSPDGVRRGLAALGDGQPLADPHDEAHLAAFEQLHRVGLGELELHRRNVLPHIANLDLACYDKDYGPAADRAAARQRHLAGWPAAVDAALAALDQLSAPVAAGLLATVVGLAAELDDSRSAVEAQALAAHRRLVTHVERCARDGDPDAALGSAALARLLGSGQALEVDLGALARDADVERDRLTTMLTEACARWAPGRSAAEVVPELLADHPTPDGVLAEARALTAEVIAFTRDHTLVPHADGECRVEPAPPSRRWAMAMLSPAAPEEPDGPSYYHVTPPDPAWPAAEQEEWLAIFSRTTLPGITAHEVAPGHFTHFRSLRAAPSAVRRILPSDVFVEGWAHYAEEVMIETGFHADDPRFAIGVAIEALLRVTRFACAIGIHTGAMTVDDATARFTADAFQHGPAARSEAARATFDPTYGRYTWGKIAILDLREQARVRWGQEFTIERFHAALMALGSPPLGLMGTALDRG
jgi:hypothetical protein